MSDLEDEAELGFRLTAWMVMQDVLRKTPSERKDDVTSLEGNFKAT